MKTSAAPSKENRGNLATPREEDRRNSAAQDTQSLEVPCSEINILKKVMMETSDPVKRVSHGADGGSSVNSESYQLLLNRRKLENIAADI
ncbi:hypothetical protein SLA2020_340190 [Shorea laevis]